VLPHFAVADWIATRVFSGDRDGWLASAVDLALGLWLLGIVATVVRSLRPEAWLWRMSGVALFASLWFWSAWRIHTGVWYTIEDDEYEARVATSVDPATFVATEQRLVETANATIVRGQPGVVELEFEGFAGSARADVFVHEVRAAKDLMEERWARATDPWFSPTTSPCATDCPWRRRRTSRACSRAWAHE